MKLELVKKQTDQRLLMLLIGESVIHLPRKGCIMGVYRGSDRKNVTAEVARAFGLPVQGSGLIAEPMALIVSLADVVKPGVILDLTYTR